MQVTTWESIDDDSVLGPVKQIVGFYNTLNRKLWGSVIGLFLGVCTRSTSHLQNSILGPGAWFRVVVCGFRD